MNLHKTAVITLALSLSLSTLAACGPKDSDKDPAGSQPGSSITDVSKPDGSGSDVSTPDVSTPDASAPDASKPDASAPDASKPDVSKPDASEPDAPAKASLTLNKSDFTLFKAGQTAHLKAQVTGTDSKVKFTSSDEKIATVAEDGTVTAVAPGNATITATAGDLSAKCVVRCKFEAAKPDTKPEPKPDTKPDVKPEASKVDLSSFAATTMANNQFGFLEQANDDLLNEYYTGLTAIPTEQRLVYICMMSNNPGEFALIQVKDSKDVASVKSILQARIDYMTSGGAYYPAATQMWTENSTVVSNGNYVMMVVHENKQAIVDSFNALLK